MLCLQDSLCKELWGYARAFRRQGVTLDCLEVGTPLNVDIRDLLDKLPARPDFILQPESDFHFLPSGLVQQDIPTVCFHFDTYHSLRRRIRWSMLYDVPVVFHPHFADDYRRAGHPSRSDARARRAIGLLRWRESFARRARLRSRMGRAAERSSIRCAAANSAAACRAIRMNDWNRSYSIEETAEIYRHSKIIVNISRDDYPQDANMRVYEAMAAGALLMTRAADRSFGAGVRGRRTFHRLSGRNGDCSGGAALPRRRGGACAHHLGRARIGDWRSILMTRA